MKLTLGQASKQTGKAKSTILKSIRMGRISAERDAFDNWAIEPVELFRVYEPLPKNQDEVGESKNLKREEPSEKTGGQVKELTARIELLERLCSQIEGERDHLREQNERLTRLLPITAGPASQEERKGKGSLWQRLFG